MVKKIKKGNKRIRKRFLLDNPLSLALFLIGLVLVVESLGTMWLLYNAFHTKILQFAFWTVFFLFNAIKFLAGLIAIKAGYRMIEK
ncbi:MAG: hypothetical protein J7K31_02815 [Candidatus Aenigmarchaeota archaeon]|nr:hypothetical protein [Candidatus Aenigmarchaeota archaeon]RLF28871.1 MAG: hypothetical protein DRN05_02950 [Thermoplasmata archaeon]